MTEAIARWCDSLNKKDVIVSALETIAEGLQAEAVALSRMKIETAGSERCITFDRRSENEVGCVLRRSFARSVLGHYFTKQACGTVWLRSLVEEDPDPALSEFHRQRKLSDLVIIPLAASRTAADFLEIHLVDRIAPVDHAVLNAIAPVLSRTWARRDPGLFTELQLTRASVSREAATSGGAILSVENPARLSRAEYRVCLMLSRGLSQDAVQDELGISTSTLRAHLRSIYSKTGTGSQAELFYALLRSTDEVRRSATAERRARVA